MKYIVLVPDGAIDYPLEELGGKTPLEAADTPNMDFIAQNGIIGRTRTIPKSLLPASDVANLSIFGYDPEKYYTGRGPLEAANLGVELSEDEIAFRCNLVTASEDRMIDYSAGHISTEEARALIKTLNENLATEDLRFYAGVSYRNLLVIRSPLSEELSKIKCIPPHDITGKDIGENLPEGETAEILIDLMDKSKQIFQNHEINKVRIDLKENPANMIWLWGQGKTPNMPKFKDRFGLEGSVISAVDLIKGLGKILGLEVINVKGATGYYDTNYLGKAEAALKALKEKDFVYLHVEATDEAGHNGDLQAKITCIERFDGFVVGTILKNFKKKKNFRILVIPDHATPLSLRTHTYDEVCFCLAGKGIEKKDFKGFNESEAKKATFYLENGYELMDHFIRQKTLPNK